MQDANTSARICRATIAFVWLYQGIVPKLLGPHVDEMNMALSIGVSPATATNLSYLGGAAELVMAGCVLWFARKTWPLWLTIALMAGLLAFVLIFTPYLLKGAFNPVTTNLCVVALCVVCLRLQRT